MAPLHLIGSVLIAPLLCLLATALQLPRPTAIQSKMLFVNGSPTHLALASPSKGASAAFLEDRAVDRRDPTSTQEVVVSTITVWVTPDETGSVATTTHKLETATGPIPLAATLGLIMPNPWQSLYTELNYTFGFIDAVPRPAPTYGGWLREVQPLLILPNHTIDILPASGTDDPTSSDAVPVGSDGLCGATVENYAVGYPFRFEDPGWYMFVVNQTYMQANVTSRNQCTHPILQQKSFFSTHTFSIAPRPTTAPGPVSPASAYTVWAAVTTSTPGSLPIDLQPATDKEKLYIAIGAAGGALGLAVIVAVMWWVRKRQKMKSEVLAFSRLSPADQEAFLCDNPDSFLNPNHPRYTAKNGVYPQSPPAPPGTVAYALWYSQHMWNSQVMQRQYPSGWSQYGQPPTMGTAGTTPSQSIIHPAHYPVQPNSFVAYQQQPLMQGQWRG
ncbi:hypothetical protein IAT38_008290 [Cryptococcus sp. DSM 104549]